MIKKLLYNKYNNFNLTNKKEPMILAIFADIHGNLEAFTSVISQIHKEGVDRIISLGDNIGYGADSEKIMDQLHKNNVESILGNHELAVINESFIKWFNPNAQQAVRYTIDNLSEKSKKTIKSLKKSLVIQNMRFVHGTPPSSVVLYLFQLSDLNLAKKLDMMQETICFTGHTHELGLIVYDGEKLVRKELKKGISYLEKDKKYVINVGSVGQPRDGDNCAKYILFNTQSMALELRYMPYDYKTAANKIIQAGLPKAFAEKLYP